MDLRSLDPQSYERADGFLTASIEAFTRKGLYQLDFRFVDEGVRIASFVLKESGPSTLANAASRPISASTEDPRVLDKAKEWIDECRRTHDQCRPLIDHKWHPNRLLDLLGADVSNGSLNQVRLVSGKGQERRTHDPFIEGDYVTLSHCWGIRPPLKLLKDNLAEFSNGIRLTNLPKTFQHAVKVCQKLDIRWLWIDALCIIQEDVTDWLEESATMEQVYANSYCNISATASEDSSQGLFRDRDMRQEWVADAKLDTSILSTRSQGRVQCTILDLDFWDKYIDHAPVNLRAWVYQERLLAPRVLHWCKNQIAFECAQVNRAEGLPDDMPHFRVNGGLPSQTDSLKSMTIEAGARLRAVREAMSSASSMERSRLQRMVDEVEDVDRKFYLYELWKHWVQVYTRTRVTNDGDRLIALSGIARMMCRKLRADDHHEEYVAGMWRKHLVIQLLWHVREGHGKDRQPFEDTRPKDYRAPSFSWASVETARGVSFPVTRDLDEDEELLSQIESVYLSHRPTGDPFGLITGGHLILTGTLQRVELKDRAQRTRKVRQVNKPWFYAVKPTQVIWAVVATCLIPMVYTMFEMCGIGHSHRHRRLLTTWTLASVAGGLLWLGTTFLHAGTFGADEYNENEDDDDDDFTNLTGAEQNRYAWRFIRGGRPVGKPYSIVHLDSPGSSPSIFGPDAQVFYMPVLREVHKDRKHIISLLLQAAEDRADVPGAACYQRVGWTKIPSYFRHAQDGLTRLPESLEAEIARDDKHLTGKRTICIF